MITISIRYMFENKEVVDEEDAFARKQFPSSRPTIPFRFTQIFQLTSTLVADQVGPLRLLKTTECHYNKISWKEP